MLQVVCICVRTASSQNDNMQKRTSHITAQQRLPMYAWPFSSRRFRDDGAPSDNGHVLCAEGGASKFRDGNGMYLAIAYWRRGCQVSINVRGELKCVSIVLHGTKSAMVSMPRPRARRKAGWLAAAAADGRTMKSHNQRITYILPLWQAALELTTKGAF